MFIAGLMTCLIFTIIRCLALRVASRQQLLIVYNIPHTTAVDCIRGTTFYYSGDTVLQNNPFLQQYYLRPARMMYRISHDGSLEQNTKSQPRLFQ